MSPRVKKIAVDYFEEIGGIESVDPDYRYALKKRVIYVLIVMERDGILDKMKGFFPMIGTLKPVKI